MARRTFDDWDRDGSDYVGRQTPLGLSAKALGWGVGIIVVLTIVGSLVGLGLGWFNTAVGVVSPQNVKAQWDFAYTYDKSLGATATQWCTAKKAEATAIGDDAINQRQTQTIAQANNYSRIEAEYDAALANAFKAKLVAPPDVPTTAPTLPQKVLALGLTGCVA